MDLKKKKYKIIEALLAVEEPSIINELEKILKMNSEESSEEDVLMEEAKTDIKAGRVYSINDGKEMISQWNSEVSEDEKSFIQAGLKDIAEGKIYTNEEVLRKINQKYGL
ncbi:hypothetical protein [Aequorivita capsosiphonis]|uniref:hypothetical protein n=1 Tax=Aequorivita capsosiphonis TaxID=487317 RepID=UPI000421A61A|nr:hypothetical protein [Aequorivita capsosiphonis]